MRLRLRGMRLWLWLWCLYEVVVFHAAEDHKHTPAVGTSLPVTVMVFPGRDEPDHGARGDPGAKPRRLLQCCQEQTHTHDPHDDDFEKVPQAHCL